jgi:hypothetical protein
MTLKQNSEGGGVRKRAEPTDDPCETEWHKNWSEDNFAKSFEGQNSKGLLENEG